MEYQQQEHYQQQLLEEEEEVPLYPLLRRPQATMEDDSSAMQPQSRHSANFSSSSSSLSHQSQSESQSNLPALPPCPPPIAPLKEPSYQVQLLLGDMFSEQATLRNYCADSIQAFMMALDEQRLLEEERKAEEEASLALIKALQDEEEESAARTTTANDQETTAMNNLSSRSQHSSSNSHQQQQPIEEDEEVSPQDDADPASIGNVTAQANQRLSLISDLTSDLGSIISEDSSLEIPDFFTTTEAVLSHMSLKGFKKEIMPIPALQSGISDEEVKIRAAAYAACRGYGGNSYSSSSSSDGHCRRRSQQGQHNSNLKIGYDSDETKSKDGSLKKMSGSSSSPVRIERLTAKGSIELKPPPGGTLPSSFFCQEVSPAAAAAAANTTAGGSSSSHSSSKNKKSKTSSSSGAASGRKKDRQCIICHRSTAHCRLRMRKLRCGHQYCRSCIDRWLECNDSCPYCRQKVSEKTRQKVRRQNSVGPTAA